MNIKSYSFAGCTIRLVSDTPVYDSGLFGNFVCDGSCQADIEVKIIHSDLPEKNGLLIFSDSVSEYYMTGGKGYYFTSFPGPNGMKELACRMTENGENVLYVARGQRLWDSLVAFAVNYNQLLFYRGIATMHSSCIETDGKALLFAGDKRAGKSTQADLWHQFRSAEIINGDRIALKPGENGIIACGIPFCGSSRLAVNRTLGVKAIVLPGKAGSNTVSRLSAADAFRSVIGKLTYNAEDGVQLKTAIDIAQRIAENVPVFSLMCVPDESAVEILEEQLCRI